MKFRMNHGRPGRGRSSGRTSNMRYIVILIALFVLFVWLMTVNIEPIVESVLALPDGQNELCLSESGEVRKIDDLILAPWKGGDGLLWIAHPSSAVTNYGYRSPTSEDPFKLPLGLTEFWGEEEPGLQFSILSNDAFRILEETYSQVYDWTRDYGPMYMVSGIIQCSDSTEYIGPGTYVYVSMLDTLSDPARSVSFLWENEWSDKPLSEMVYSLEKINELTGLEIFYDIRQKLELKRIEEVKEVLSMGYNTNYYQQRMVISDQ